MIRILVQEGDAERATHVVDRPAIRIGRDPGNDVMVRDRFVSARHGEIRMGAEGLRYEDFCTTNGSRLLRDGREIPVDSSCSHRVELREGDELLLGDRKQPVRLRFDLAPARVFGPRGPLGPRHAPLRSEIDAAMGETLVLMPQDLEREVLLSLHRLTARLASRTDPTGVIAAFGDATLEAFPRANHVSVWLVDGDGAEFRSALALGRQGTTGVRPVSRTVRDRVLALGKALAFTDNEEEFDLAESLHDSRVRAGICAPLWDGRRIGGLVQVDCRGVPLISAFPSGDLETLVLFAHQAAMALSNARLHESLRKGAEQVITGLISAIEARDPLTAGRAGAVAGLCEATCLALGLDPPVTRAVRRAGLVHAIGTLAQGPHDDSEAAQALLGARILAPLESLADVVPIVRHQHECWDGTGPAGLAGRDIPLGARILAACKAWHRLANGGHGASGDRLSQATALASLREHAGGALDPSIVDELADLVGGAMPHGTELVPAHAETRELCPARRDRAALT